MLYVKDIIVASEFWLFCFNGNIYRPAWRALNVYLSLDRFADQSKHVACFLMKLSDTILWELVWSTSNYLLPRDVIYSH